MCPDKVEVNNDADLESRARIETVHVSDVMAGGTCIPDTNKYAVKTIINNAATDV